MLGCDLPPALLAELMTGIINVLLRYVTLVGTDTEKKERKKKEKKKKEHIKLLLIAFI